MKISFSPFSGSNSDPTEPNHISLSRCRLLLSSERIVLPLSYAKNLFWTLGKKCFSGRELHLSSFRLFLFSFLCSAHFSSDQFQFDQTIFHLARFHVFSHLFSTFPLLKSFDRRTFVVMTDIVARRMTNEQRSDLFTYLRKHFRSLFDSHLS